MPDNPDKPAPSTPAPLPQTPSTPQTGDVRPQPVSHPETITKSTPPGELGVKREG
jgi:hypothetical protein